MEWVIRFVCAGIGAIVGALAVGIVAGGCRSEIEERLTMKDEEIRRLKEGIDPADWPKKGAHR